MTDSTRIVSEHAAPPRVLDLNSLMDTQIALALTERWTAQAAREDWSRGEPEPDAADPRAYDFLAELVEDYARAIGYQIREDQWDFFVSYIGRWYSPCYQRAMREIRQQAIHPDLAQAEVTYQWHYRHQPRID